MPTLLDAPSRAARPRIDDSVASGQTASAAPAETLPASALTGDGTHDQISWRFVRWLVVTALVLLVVVGGFNAWVDSTGTLGTGLVDPMAELPRDRRAKVQLIERAGSPALVVLGSSRAKRLEPARLAGGADKPGVNAAVVGSDMLEQLVMTKWLAQRARDDGREFPHLVVGVDVEQWRDRSLRETGLLAVPQLATIARAEARGGTSLTTLGGQIDDLVLSWSATRTSVAALRSREASESKAEDAAQDEERVTHTRDVDEFRPDGILRSDSRWLTPKGRAHLRRELPKELRATIAGYRGRYGSLGPDAERYFDELVRTANEQGDVPTVFLTPMHPAMVRALEPEGRAERLELVRDILTRLDEEGRIVLVDCSDCLGARAVDWVDGVHPSPTGARRLAKELSERAAAHRDTSLAAE